MCAQNFVKNSMRVFDDASVAKLWEYLDGVREEISKEEKEQKEAAVVAVTIPVPEKKNAEKSTKKGVSSKSGRQMQLPWLFSGLLLVARWSLVRCAVAVSEYNMETMIAGFFILLLSLRNKWRIVGVMWRRKQKNRTVDTRRPRCPTCNSLLENKYWFISELT